MPRQSIVCVSLILSGLVLVNTDVALADVGPKGYNSYFLDVEFDEGSEISPTKYNVVMLWPTNEFSGGYGNSRLPDLDKHLPDGWKSVTFGSRSLGKENRFEFRPYRPGTPSDVRFLVYFKDRNEYKISNAVGTDPFMVRYRLRVEGLSNRQLALERVDRGRWFSSLFLGLWDRGLMVALLITVGVELLICFALFRFVWQDIENRRRGLLTSLFVNLTSMPVLWCVAVVGFWMLGFWAGFAFLMILELLVFCFESLGYRLAGKLNWQRAFSLSALANIGSILAGLMCGYF